MKLVIQRCQEASVSVNGKTVGAIEKGLMVLIGVGKEDTTEVVDKYLKKLLQLRIFEDEKRQDKSFSDDGHRRTTLLVSQFTLYAGVQTWKSTRLYGCGEILKKQKSYMNI
ncbi:MAG: D-aminoacyl-tRNA deacylase [Lachnospiraceae bacterium]